MTLEEYLQDAKESYENHLDENHIPKLIEIIETMRRTLVEIKSPSINARFGLVSLAREYEDWAKEALQKCEEIVGEK